jgi:hypothetical protein
MTTALLFGLSVGGALAQTAPTTPAGDLVGKSTTAVGYVVGGGSTKVDFKATTAVPKAAGEAKVEARQGLTNIEVKVEGLPQPTTLGTEFLTYVLWVVVGGANGQCGQI